MPFKPEPMPFTPQYPLPRSTASHLELRVEDRRNGRRGDLEDWDYVDGSLTDHPGLAYYRYVPIDPGDDVYGEQARDYANNHATKFVQAVARRFVADTNGRGSQPWHEPCRRHALRLKAAIEAFRELGRAVQIGERTTATRLLVGMGYKNALEVGLTFHHPGGFPYLPGTSIKGLTRAWAEQVERVDKPTLQRLFGSDTKQVDDLRGEMVAGSVVFLDAVPVRFPPLDADLLNPHYSDYYNLAKNATPGDWHSPVPVPFLAVGAGATFQFALVGRDAEAQTAEDVEQAWRWLMDALTHLGAGGKTSTGYGYFEADRSSQSVSVPGGESRAHQGAEPAPLVGETSPPVQLRPGIQGVRAEIVDTRDRKAWVRLHAVGVEGQTFKMEGRYNVEGFNEGEIVLVEVDKNDWDKKANRPRQVRYMRRAN